MNGLRDKIRVEPLDERRYERLEQRVMAAYEGIAYEYAEPPPWHHRLWRLGRVMAPALAVAAVLLVAYFGLRASSEPESVQPVARTGAPARLITDDTGETTYHIGNAEITVAASSTLEIRREPVAKAAAPGEAIHVDLLTGTIDCDVEPLADRPPFIVHAGDVDVTVVGTAFRVAYENGTVRVSVVRGRVQVTDPSGSRMLGAGESWSSDVQVATAGGQTQDSGSDIRLPGRQSSGPVAVDADEGRGHLRGRTATSPSGTSGKSDRDGANSDRSRKRSGRKARKSRGKRSAGAGSGEIKERRELKQARPPRGKPPTGHAELTAIMADELDDPRAAVDRYLKVARGRGGAAAEFALYSVAYLQAMKLGRRSATLATLKHYQRRFARGTHREWVLWLRIRMLCAGSDRNACRAAAHSYLKDFPAGKYADLAGRLIHWDM